MSSSKWLLRLFICILCIMCILAGTVFAIDPYLHYRTRDNSYFLHYRFVVPGIIKNADYNSVVIGSSMTQNFQMDEFREKLSVNPIKATVSGTTLADLKTMTRMVNETGKAKTYYICMDLPVLINSNASIIPEYLADDSIWNDYRYWFGYEAWMRFIPVDLAFLGLKAMDVELPAKFHQSMSIDRLEEWGNDYIYDEDVVLDEFVPGHWRFDNKTLEARLHAGFDAYVECLDLEHGNYVLFFPPYSSCYWHCANEFGWFDIFADFKKYVVEYFEEYENVQIFDFQAADFTMDLNNYKDITHYGPHINSWMVDCFASGEYLVSSELVEQNIQQMEENVRLFRQRYSARLELE